MELAFAERRHQDVLVLVDDALRRAEVPSLAAFSHVHAQRAAALFLTSTGERADDRRTIATYESRSQRLWGSSASALQA
jgi:hypothetical protein